MNTFTKKLLLATTIVAVLGVSAPSYARVPDQVLFDDEDGITLVYGQPSGIDVIPGHEIDSLNDGSMKLINHGNGVSSLYFK